MLPAKNYNIVNFILSNLDCCAFRDNFSLIERVEKIKIFKGEKKKRKINKNIFLVKQLETHGLENFNALIRNCDNSL